MYVGFCLFIRLYTPDCTRSVVKKNIGMECLVLTHSGVYSRESCTIGSVVKNVGMECLVRVITFRFEDADINYQRPRSWGYLW